MNRQRLVALIGMAVLAGSAFAQPADRAKYEIIRETINFLATDKAVSQDTNFRISCETLDYDCFQQQLAAKPIAGIDRWYNGWRSMKATDEATLNALRRQIFADILERPGKGYRKQLPGYKSYAAQVANLIDHHADEQPAAAADLDTAQESAPNDVGSSTPIYPAQFTNQEENEEKEETMIAYLALAIGIIALVIAGRPILFGKKEQQPALDTQELRDRLDRVAVQLKRLEQRVADNQIRDDAIASLTDIMESVEKRVVELERRTRHD